MGDLTTFDPKPILVLRIVLARCNNVYGVAPCTASGGQCHYSFETCEDPDNYILSSAGRQILIQSHDMPLLKIDHIKPYLVGIGGIETELDPKFGNTLNPRLEVNVKTDSYERDKETPQDHDKGSGKYFSGATSGDFWGLLLRRNPNVRGKLAELYIATPSDTSTSTMKRIFAGEIEHIERGEFESGLFTIVLSDPLKRLQNLSAPEAISEANLTTLELLSTDRRIPVENASEFKMLPHEHYCIKQSGSFGLYHVNKRTGKQTLIHTFTSLFFGQSQAPAYDGKGRIFYYVAPDGAGDSALMTLDILTGRETQIGIIGGAGSGIIISSMAYDCLNDVLYATQGSNLYTINVSDATSTLIAAFSGATAAQNAIAYDPIDDVLYGVRDSTDSIYTINKTTAVTTLVGAIGFTKTFDHLTFDKSSNTLYALDSGSGVFYSINQATGSGTAVLTLDVGTSHGVITVSTQEAVISLKDTVPVSLINIDETLRMVYVDTANKQLVVDRRPFFGRAAQPHPTIGLQVKQQAAFYEMRTSAYQTDPDNGLNPIRFGYEVMTAWNEIPVELFDYTSLSDAILNWHRRDRYRLAAEKPIKCFAYIQALNEATGGAFYFTDENKIAFAAYRPALPHETVETARQGYEILNAPRPTIDYQEDAQRTRFHAFYDPITQDKLITQVGDNSVSEFNKIEAYIDELIERKENYDFKHLEEVANSLIYRRREARRFINKRARRFRKPPAKFSWSQGVRDIDKQKVGDLVDITHDYFRTANGATESKRFQVIRRGVRAEQGVIDYVALDTRTDYTYGGIAHSGASNYNVTLDRQHAHIGVVDLVIDGIPMTAVMSNGDPGFNIF